MELFLQCERVSSCHVWELQCKFIYFVPHSLQFMVASFLTFNKHIIIMRCFNWNLITVPPRRHSQYQGLDFNKLVYIRQQWERQSHTEWWVINWFWMVKQGNESLDTRGFMFTFNTHAHILPPTHPLIHLFTLNGGSIGKCHTDQWVCVSHDGNPTQPPQAQNTQTHTCAGTLKQIQVKLSSQTVAYSAAFIVRHLSDVQRCF